MIDIAATQNSLDSLGSYVTYGVARLYYPIFLQLLGDEASAAGLNDWLNFGNSSIKGTLSKFEDTMRGFGNDLLDTSSHPPDAVYDRWAAFKDFCMQIAIEANAVEEGTGHTFENIDLSITQDIPDAVEEAPGVIGDVVGKVTAGAAGALGNTVGSLLTGLGLPLLIGAAVLVFVYAKSR